MKYIYLYRLPFNSISILQIPENSNYIKYQKKKKEKMKPYFNQI